ncbi:COP9 signalosome complex subunit 5 [Trypanosoma brucei equiperdum]|uniref:COP9 signalosome complex subunit 5 n=1 Tax=Trypanosoma brucei equiperdum TaxID=630700 RepID=A0A3L6LAG4_9TRYP|nr:COP9 signalosome complex subunit 5 [Trypanosoma brucei equiperdum]
MIDDVVTDDDFLRPDAVLMENLHKAQPWKSAPRYFRSVRVSVLAVLQMLSHSDRGRPNVVLSDGQAILSSPQTTTDTQRRENWFEVMGLLLGHFRENELIVTSTFALPVDASEVECSMNEASQMYMLEYLQYHQRTGFGVKCGWNAEEEKEVDEEIEEAECCVGWYHSHPGYTCFLSGTDVATQRVGQAAQDPWLAIVVDPVRTISTGRVDMRAFRTFPEGAVGDGTESTSADSTGIGAAPRQCGFHDPLVREYGAHGHCYYELPITLVRSTNDEKLLEHMLSRDWAAPLRGSPSLGKRHDAVQQIQQITALLEGVSPSQERKDGTGSRTRELHRQQNNREGDRRGATAVTDASVTDVEQLCRLAETLALEAKLGDVVQGTKRTLFAPQYGVDPL